MNHGLRRVREIGRLRQSTRARLYPWRISSRADDSLSKGKVAESGIVGLQGGTAPKLEFSNAEAPSQ